MKKLSFCIAEPLPIFAKAEIVQDELGAKIEREKAQNIHDALRFVEDNISYFS
ncbi:MAG: hypothetical protein PUI06_01665 [Prevotella sp.]|nr:hypothetical protein [Prevotella sp.]MDY5666275.1 hypothetical protein [Alloprevotella sp.]